MDSATNNVIQVENPPMFVMMAMVKLKDLNEDVCPVLKNGDFPTMLVYWWLYPDTSHKQGDFDFPSYSS